MSTEVLTTPLDTAPHQAEFAFADVNAIEDLRRMQQESIDQAESNAVTSLPLGDRFIKSGEARDTARTQVVTGFDDMSNNYVANHINKDEQPALYNGFRVLVRQTAVDKMDDMKWEFGDKDDDGNYSKPETSGKAIVRQALEQMRGNRTGNTIPTPPNATEAAIHAAAEAGALQQVNTQRQRLAELSIARRQLLRNKGKKAKNLANQYEVAEADYKNATLEHGRARVNRLRFEGKSDSEIRTQILSQVITERRDFTQAEYNLLQNDPTKRSAVTRWLAKRSHLVLASAGSGIAIGYGLGKLTHSVAKASLWGLAPGLAIGAGLAVKSTKAAVVASIGNKVYLHRQFQQRADQDMDKLNALHDEHTANIPEANHDQLLGAANAGLVENTADRVKRDQRSNRSRVIAATALGGAGVIGGALLADYVHWPFGGGHHTPADSSTGGNSVVDHNNGGGRNSDAAYRSHTNTSDTTTQTAARNPNIVDGYNSRVMVEDGHGYIVEFKELAEQKGFKLPPNTSWDQMYNDMNKQFNGNFFVDNGSYVRDAGDWGIDRPGYSTWRPEVITDMEKWGWFKANANNS